MTTKLTRETYTALDAVRDFHVRNGQVVNDQPPSTALGSEVAILRIRLIVEEHAETIISLHEKNLIHFADGLTDLLYVILGTAVSYGVPIPDEFDFPAPVLKGFGLPSEIDSLTFMEGTGDFIQDTCTCLRNMCASCDCPDPACQRKTVTENDYTNLQKVLHKGVKTLCHVAVRHGIPLRDLFFEVHRSNMSKVLGGAGTGGKYGPGGGKGEGYTPPDVQGILLKHQPPPGEVN